MKQPGDTIAIIDVRAGERLYGRDYQVIARSSTWLHLKTVGDPVIVTEIKVVDNGTLHDDALCGPPKVEIVHQSQGFRRHNTEKYSAYFYELNDLILLLLL